MMLIVSINCMYTGGSTDVVTKLICYGRVLLSMFGLVLMLMCDVSIRFELLVDTILIA